MKKILRLCSLAALCAGATDYALAQDNATWVIRSRSGDSSVEFDPNTGEATAPGGVIITYRDAILSADRVTANETTGEALAEGSVKLKFDDAKRGPVLWTGDHLHYNFKTKAISSDTFKTGQTPIYIQGEGLRGDQTNNVYSATNAVLTSDNYAEPATKIRARQITFVPGQYIEAESAVLYVGDMPTMYLPYYRRSLGRHETNFSFLPGYRSLYGPYLLSSYNWYLNDEVSGAVHADYREKRGFGVGPDLSLVLGPYGDAVFKYYYIHDLSPGLDPNGNPTIPKDRHRLYFSYNVEPRTNLTFKALIRDQSDAEMIRDFFESEYKQRQQPNSYIEGNQSWPNFTLNAEVQPQVNTFFETVERLPDVQFNALRQQLGDTPFYYESQSSGAWLRRRFVDPSLDFEAARFDTFHQIVLPHTFFGFLTVTPRVGGRLTYYSQAEGTGAMTDEHTRGVFNTGAEISTKLSRTWAGVESQFWSIDGLRHVLEPSINYVYVPSPNITPTQLPQFDYELPTLRPLPITYPDYTAIDSIDSQNVLRFGLYNRLQTKRAGAVENVVDWGVIMDWRLRPRTGQGTFGDLYSDLSIRPHTWITFNSQLRYNISEQAWKELDSRLILHPQNDWSLTLGHRYLASDPIIGVGDNSIYSILTWRFNENWGVRVSDLFEARDGVLQEQYYTIYRDLRSWTTALTVRMQNNVGAPSDFAVALSLSLKASPRYGVARENDSAPELLMGR